MFRSFWGSGQTCNCSFKSHKRYAKQIFGAVSFAHVLNAGAPGARNCWSVRLPETSAQNATTDSQVDEPVQCMDLFDLPLQNARPDQVLCAYYMRETWDSIDNVNTTFGTAVHV